MSIYGGRCGSGFWASLLFILVLAHPPPPVSGYNDLRPESRISYTTKEPWLEGA